MLTTNEEFWDKEERVRFRVEALEKELKQTRHSIDDYIKEAKVSKKKKKDDKGNLTTTKNSLENKKILLLRKSEEYLKEKLKEVCDKV